MLLRFTEARPYKFLRDSVDNYWFDFGSMDPALRVTGLKIGRPLVVYLGQEKVEDGTYYGKFRTVRKVSVEGKIVWVFPAGWRYLEGV